MENELHTHLAATARRFGCPHGDLSNWGDVPEWCDERLWRQIELEPEEWFPVPPEAYVGFAEGVSWFPDDPEWVREEMSWLQRHLVDVYAVYGALVMGVGLLMKLTWNLVW